MPSRLVVRVKSGRTDFQDHLLNDLEGEAEPSFMVVVPIGIPSPCPPNRVVSLPLSLELRLHIYLILSVIGAPNLLPRLFHYLVYQHIQ